MNKQPWPLRYLADRPSAAVEALLNDLIADGIARPWTIGIYEPETDAFGGTKAMTAAHALFHEDSRHLLAYQPDPGQPDPGRSDQGRSDQGRLGRRETAVLLMSSLMRAEGAVEIQFVKDEAERPGKGGEFRMHSPRCSRRAGRSPKGMTTRVSTSARA